MAAQPQASVEEERRTERATATLTTAEKEDFELVRLVDKVTESDLLRDVTVAEVQGRANEIRERTRAA